jgi:hypothetical protein
MTKELFEAIEQAWSDHKETLEGRKEFGLYYSKQIDQLISFAKEKLDE